MDETMQTDKTTNELPQLFTINDVAEILKISQRSIWRLVALGNLVAPLRVGGSIRWKREDIREWFDQRFPPLRKPCPEAQSTPVKSQEKGLA